MKIEISNQADLPTKFGDFWAKSFREFIPNQDTPLEHLVVWSKELGQTPLVRIHSECLTGDVFGSKKCDCGNELALAMQQIAQNKPDGGMLIYLRQEGRGIGLFNKINAYHLQDQGFDTVEANEKLGFPSDMRNYDIIKEIFKHFNITQINLLTNNPKKISALSPYAKVVRHSIITPTNPHNENYLIIKKEKMGHLL